MPEATFTAFSICSGRVTSSVQWKELIGLRQQWSKQVRVASAKIDFSGTALEKLLDECAADPAIRSGKQHYRAWTFI
jgi:hypothetical protein